MSGSLLWLRASLIRGRTSPLSLQLLASETDAALRNAITIKSIRMPPYHYSNQKTQWQTNDLNQNTIFVFRFWVWTSHSQSNIMMLLAMNQWKKFIINVCHEQGWYLPEIKYIRSASKANAGTSFLPSYLILYSSTITASLSSSTRCCNSWTSFPGWQPVFWLSTFCCKTLERIPITVLKNMENKLFRG